MERCDTDALWLANRSKPSVPRRTLRDLKLKRTESNVMDDRPNSLRPFLSRSVGILFGIGTQLGFFATVWFLFFFLKDGRKAATERWFLVDLLLALQFAVIHSLLLLPTVKRSITRLFPSEFYGCLFCVATCLQLGTVFVAWQVSSGTLWNMTGIAALVMQVGFYASWIGLFYSLYLSGLGYQTGLTPWWYWLCRKPQPRRTFEARGVYRLFRHPIYLSFLGLIWFTPRMSWDHALLTGLWTIYIFIGSYLKDERLAFYMGAPYRRYQEQVVGYPLMFFGPLGRRKCRIAPVVVRSVTADSGSQLDYEPLHSPTVARAA
jgi:methanethiol S-methyltransferase